MTQDLEDLTATDTDLEPLQAPGPEPKRLMVFCTHHKTGTVWMLGIIRALRRKFSFQVVKAEQADVTEETDIFFQNHSQINMEVLRETFPGRKIRAVHIIRDPRDVLISGCFYHVKTTERWANVPQPRYNGLTYREAIGAQPTDHDKLVFEMDGAARSGIRDMVGWHYGDPDVFEARYEELIGDKEFEVFRPMMQFFGFEGKELKRVLRIVERKSLFGGASAKPGSVHVRSGESRQWPKIFTPELKQEFKNRFPDELQRLGYEKDDNW
ncbi:MAG TPA: sulfotransferase domain-containing protein [Ideonella sp.]|nr:sulfotransferase domain-containing protein [Ideonella sp.]